jgi:hypothetical protein
MLKADLAQQGQGLRVYRNAPPALDRTGARQQFPVTTRSISQSWKPLSF